MKSLKLKINKKSILYFIMALVFVKPRYFEEFSIIDNAFNVLRIVFGGMVIITYLKNNRISKLFIISTLFFLPMILSSIYYNVGILRCVMYMIVSLSMVCIVEKCVRDKTFIFLDSFYICYFVLLLINFICMFIFPNGLYIQAGDIGNFLNIDNLLGHHILISTMLSLINLQRNKYKKISIFCIIISVFTIIKVWTVTALVAEFILIILYICYKKLEILKKVLTPKNLIIIYVVLISIYIFNSNIEILSKIFTDFLGKDLTFSGRTYIWEEFFRRIRLGQINIIFGNGVQNSNRIIVPRFGVEVHLHNQFLNIIYEGGLLSLGLFISILLVVIKKLNIYKDKNISTILSITIFALMYFMLMEINRDLEYLFLLLSLSFYCKELNDIKL